MEGLREESLYARNYWALRQPLIDMLFDGVAFDVHSARAERERLDGRKTELKLELDSRTGQRLYAVHRHRSQALLDLLDKQRAIRAAKKGLGRSDEGKRLGVELRAVQQELRDLRAAGGDVELEIGAGLSDQRVAAYLYETLKLPTARRRRKDSGKVTVTVDDLALQRLSMAYPVQRELIFAIREHRRCEKLVSTYLNPEKLCSPVDGRFHSQYKTFGTQSLRLSSGGDPWGFGGNAQNLDREYKWLMLPELPDDARR